MDNKEKHYFMRICSMCGKVFESESNNTRYCSDECRKQAIKISEHKRVQKDKDRAILEKNMKRAKKWHAFSSPSEYGRIQKEETVALYARIDLDKLYKDVLQTA